MDRSYGILLAVPSAGAPVLPPTHGTTRTNLPYVDEKLPRDRTILVPVPGAVAVKRTGGDQYRFRYRCRIGTRLRYRAEADDTTHSCKH